MQKPRPKNREDMAKLEAAFTTAGFSAEQAKDVYSDFYAILGEEDRSVEAVNHLAKLTIRKEELKHHGRILRLAGCGLPSEIVSTYRGPHRSR